MKGVFCPDCHDIVLFVFDVRSCRCGRCKGLYVNDQDAVTNGEGFALAIGNGSFDIAVCNLAAAGKDHDRQYFLDAARISHAWLRPHEGPGNPHSRVDKEFFERIGG